MNTVASSKAIRKPDFLIVGTQKAGTTWLRSNLYAHPLISGPSQQLHFFDLRYHRGIKWYAKQFRKYSQYPVVGEKTTEYFDTLHTETVACRIARDCPKAKVIIILRDPVQRALSALQHLVIAGIERLPSDPNKLLFEDLERGPEDSFRYIERGFYADQLQAFLRFIPEDQIKTLILEEDIVEAPLKTMNEVFHFLGVVPVSEGIGISAVNAPRLSICGILGTRMCRQVPKARGLIRRLDQKLPLKKWQPAFTDDTKRYLAELYRPENEKLYRILGRRIPIWEKRMASYKNLK